MGLQHARMIAIGSGGGALLCDLCAHFIAKRDILHAILVDDDARTRAL